MTLRTQVQPYALVGSSIADRPAPGGIEEGVTFLDELSGAFYELVIDPATTVRSWRQINGGALAGSSLLTFAGGGTGLALTPVPAFFANDVTGTTTPPAPGPGYVAPSTGLTVVEMLLNVRENTFAAPLLVSLYINGVPVVPAIPVPATFTGVLSVQFVAGNVAPLSRLDVGVSSATTQAGNIQAAATLVVR